KGVLIVGDLTRKNTFDQIKQFWVPDVKLYCKLAPIVLIANKIDLKKEVSEDEIDSLGREINAISIIHTSAKTGENVENAFKIISEQVINKLN
ncbi:MAG: ADP-ribosylation factor-like protein, partial [Candidatus Thorarchaeota archaeon]